MKPMGKENSFTLTEIFMKVTGKMGKLMAMESLYIILVVDMKDIGKMI